MSEGSLSSESELYLNEKWAVAVASGRHIAVNVETLDRRIISPEVALVLNRAKDGASSSALACAHPAGPGQGQMVVQSLRLSGLLTEPGRPGRGGARGVIPRLEEEFRVDPRASLAYGSLRPLIAAGDSGPRRGDIRLTLVGGCVMQFARAATHDKFALAGYNPSVTTLWPGARAADLEIPLKRTAPDIIVLAPFVETLLRGIFDPSYETSAVDLARRGKVLSRTLVRFMNEVATYCPSALIIMHTLSEPGLSGRGRLEGLERRRLSRVVGELNDQILIASQEHHNVLVLDEEYLVRRWGTDKLFDDSVFPFAHHGGSLDIALDTPNQLEFLEECLAQEYYNLWVDFGFKKIKCLAVDLDNTLWPGVMADGLADWHIRDTTSSWMHRGLHEALKIVKERGVLLASVSRGNPDHTLSEWRRNSEKGLLDPDDFVAHYIRWGAKSESMFQLCEDLRVSPESVAFLDDMEIERAEVRKFGPPIMIVERPVHEFRSWILTEPRLEIASRTAESANRTETTRASLKVEAAKRDNPDGFAEILGEMEVRLVVRPAVEGDRTRLVELLSRTTQFTNGGPAPSDADYARGIADNRVFVVELTDRDASYGIVGACIVEGNKVAHMAVSCRVIAYDVGPAFICTVIDHLGGDLWCAKIVKTDRNNPARDVYRQVGFDCTRDDHECSEWVLYNGGLEELSRNWPHQIEWRGVTA